MRWAAPERLLCAGAADGVTNNRKKLSKMQVNTIGLDPVKQAFQVHGVDGEGLVVLRQRLRQSEVGHFPSILSGLCDWHECMCHGSLG